MEGIKNLRGLRAPRGFRRKIVLEEPTTTKKSRTTNALQERLEELLVFEIFKDGGQRYRNLNLRGLYKHVLAAITNREAVKQARQDSTLGLLKHIGAGPRMDAPADGGEPSNNSPSSSIPKPAIRRSRAQSVGMLSSNRNVEGGPETVAGVGSEPITFRERLGGYIHPRDMRRLVTPFSATNKPDVIVRRHVMLLNFDPLRAIILRDRLLVLVPDGADSLLSLLERKVRGKNEAFFAEFTENNNVGESGCNKKDEATTGSSAHSNSAKGGFFGKILLKNGAAGFLSKQSGDPTSSLSGHSNATERQSLVAAPVLEGSEKGDNKSNDAQGEKKEDDDDVDDGDDEEWDEMQGREWIDLPFELQCLDAVLQCVTELLADDTKVLQEAVHHYVHQVVQPKQANGDDPLIVIRVLDDALKEMTTRVKSFEKSITRCLDEDEDMALMNLSRLLTHPERFIQPVSQDVLEEESDEPELILEAHLQDAMSLSNILGLLRGQIDTSSELLDRQLDATRNKILVANMILMVMTMGFATVAVAASIFGMNLNSYVQEKPHLFLLVTFTAIGGTLCLCIFVFYLLVETKTLQW